MSPVVGDGRKDGRARKRKPTYWCEGCSKNFGSERNYSVHRARGRACNLIRSPAAIITSTTPVAPVAQRYHVTSDRLGREFDPGKRDFSH